MRKPCSFVPSAALNQNDSIFRQIELCQQRVVQICHLFEMHIVIWHGRSKYVRIVLGISIQPTLLARGMRPPSKAR